MKSPEIDFDKIIATVTPYFVKVYGEEYKSFIEGQLKKVVPIFYVKLDEKKSEVNHELAKLGAELTLEFLDSLGVPITKEQREEVEKEKSCSKIRADEKLKELLYFIFDRAEYSDLEYTNFRNFSLDPLDSPYKVKMVTKWLEGAGIHVKDEDYNEWIKTLEAKEFFDSLKKGREILKKLDAKYSEAYKKFESVIEEYSEAQKEKTRIEKKYMFEYADELKHLFSDEDFLEIEQYRNSEFSYGLTRTKIFSLIGDLSFEEGIYSAFSSESERKLNDPETTNYNRKNILEKRIEYFKLLGLYDDSPAEEFLSRRSIRDAFPKKGFIKRVMNLRNSYQEKVKNEYVRITSSIDENNERINSEGLFLDTSVTIEDIEKGVKCIKPNAKVNGDDVEMAAVLVYSVESEYSDVKLIHELNHAIELLIQDLDEDKVVHKCGFETNTTIKGMEEDDSEERPYEQFSEIINHCIAKDVTRKMHEDGVFIFDDPETSKIDNCTSYEHNEKFVQEFYRRYKDAIIKSRTSASMEPLFSLVGEDNFEELNQIVNEHTALPYYQMMGDYMKKKDTELTRKLISLIERKQKVDSKMRSYELSLDTRYHNKM